MLKSKSGKWIALVLVLMLSVSVIAGCTSTQPGGDGAAQPAGEGNEVTSLVWGSASLGSSAQMVCSAIGTVVNKYEPSLKISVQTTGGSTENPRLLRDKKIDLAHTTEGYNASHSSGVFEGEEPVNLLAMFTMYSNELVFLVREDSPIKTMDDLKGKRVACGPPGSGTSQMSKAALEAYGLWEGDIIEKSNLGYNESGDALKDGTVDAIAHFTSAGIASPALQQLDATTKLRSIPLDNDILQAAYEKYPDFAPCPIPAGALECIDEDIMTLASFSIEFSDERLSEDHAYIIIKNIYENLDELKVYHNIASTMNLENALNGIPAQVPVHPGAAKYYKEKGVWRDDLTVGTLN